MFKESGYLFKLWLKNPRQIGAIAASGPDLAAAMARQIPKPLHGYVVELGGGTGPVTQAILASGIAPERLIVVERDPDLHKILVKKFPDVRILLGDALHLGQLLKRNGIRPIGAVVSGLPLLAMKKSVQHRIGAQIFRVLEPGAPLIQFTYGLFSPLSRRRLGLDGRIEARILNNLPPASVWRYCRPAAKSKAA